MKYQRNTVPKLAFTDDWMFSMVMRDEDICRELLTRILPNEQFGSIHLANPDGTFSENVPQNPLNTNPMPENDFSDLTNQIQAALKFGSENHGVRFDAYIQSEELWAEIEMQRFAPPVTLFPTLSVLPAS